MRVCRGFARVRAPPEDYEDYEDNVVDILVENVRPLRRGARWVAVGPPQVTSSSVFRLRPS